MPVVADGINFRVDKPEDNFIARSLELEELRLISSSENAQIVAVSGMGGVGKTQLIRKFIEIYRTEYRNVIWIDSENDENIAAAFEELSADVLHLTTVNANGKKKDFKSVVEQVVKKLSERKTLFVYDNVDSNEMLRSILASAPPIGEKVDIFITSQLREWRDGIREIPLGVWSSNESIEYISKILRNGMKPLSEEMKLAETLENFPLAIRQATAYINHQRKRKRQFNILDYIVEFTSKKRKMLDSVIFQANCTSLYKKTTYTTWAITLDTITNDESDGKLAIKILSMIAYFDANSIDRCCFENLIDDDGNDDIDNDEWEERLDSALDLLIKYCIVDSHRGIFNVRYFSVHRLVQEVMKLKLNESRKEETTVRDALKLLSESTLKFKSQSIRHAISVFKFASTTLPLLIKELSSPPRVETMSLIACCYAVMDKHTDALQMYVNVFEFQRNTLGESHSDTLRTKNEIAEQYFRLQQATVAFRLLHEIYETQKNTLGESHPHTIAAKRNIAGRHTMSWEGDLGELFKAQRLYREIYETLSKDFGENHSDTCKAKETVADYDRLVARQVEVHVAEFKRENRDWLIGW